MMITAAMAEEATYSDPDINPLAESKILIIDDDSFSRAIVNEIFMAAGFSNINLAENGLIGLEKTKLLEPDLVLLDLMMPELDGFEYCKKIRKDPKFKTMPILVQSAASNPKEIKKAFRAGVTDFVSKPVNPDEVIARAKVHLENRLLVHDLELYKARVEKELSNAKKTQQSILPSVTEIKEIGVQYGLDVGVHFEPSSELGGDFWGIKSISDTKLAIYTIDFSGHGVTSALNTFRIHTILQEQNKFSLPAGAFLSVINNQLNELLETGQFATMFYGIIDIEKNIIKYSSAGAPSPFIMNSAGQVSIIDSSGLPLGVSKDTEYNTKEMKFPVGATFMMYSDALIETEDANGNLISEENLMKMLKEYSGYDSIKIIQKLVDFFHLHMKNSTPDDDLTINIYRRSV